MLVFETNGTVTLIDDADTSRTTTVADGWTAESLAEAAAAFFGPAVEAVPDWVWNYQFRAALAELGLLDGVVTAVSAAPLETQIRFGAPGGVGPGAPQLYRTDQDLIDMARQLGKSDAEVDAVFRLAKTKQ